MRGMDDAKGRKLKHLHLSITESSVRRRPMKKLLLIVALVVASAVPALATDFQNPYRCELTVHC
jgi:hypothetical protein